MARDELRAYLICDILFYGKERGGVAMTREMIKHAVMEIIPYYPIRRVVLFGSRATDEYRENSDVDLIIEFSILVSLLFFADIIIKLEYLLGLDVDIIHGPIQKTDFIRATQEIELYAA
ncbi:MAG: nucleotidyltransferase domain-containing protein [Lachnospiraceae bacterium]|nr:nucleotidyltransferase domain-containing protein [Lachnospiraceae bacterium]